MVLKNTKYIAYFICFFLSGLISMFTRISCSQPQANHDINNANKKKKTAEKN